MRRVADVVVVLLVAAVAAQGAALAERVRGTPRDDYLKGTDGDDVLRARDGADVLLGLTGDDRLSGGPGWDGLYGGPGDDRLSGGADPDGYGFGPDWGRDTIVDAGAGNRLSIDAPPGTVAFVVDLAAGEARSSAGDVVRWDGDAIDHATVGTGNDAADTITGNDRANRLSTTYQLPLPPGVVAGPDTVLGRGGDDEIDVADGAGDDTVECGDGDDAVRFDPGDAVADDCEDRAEVP